MFVKICGITSEEDALGAVAMGADAIGFVFAPSPRQIDRITAGDISRRLPQEILSVGVFMNHSRENVVKTANQVGLKAVQLHGNESPEDTQWIKQRVQYVIKSFEAGSTLLQNAADWRADVILIDSPSPGSGEIFDWAKADDAPMGMRILLAGGLTPENVAEAALRVNPWGVDVSTGVEKSPGIKDLKLIKKFVEAVKSVSQQTEGLNPVEKSSDEPFNWEQ